MILAIQEKYTNQNDKKHIKRIENNLINVTVSNAAGQIDLILLITLFFILFKKVNRKNKDINN